MINTQKDHAGLLRANTPTKGILINQDQRLCAKCGGSPGLNKSPCTCAVGGNLLELSATLYFTINYTSQAGSTPSPSAVSADPELPYFGSHVRVGVKSSQAGLPNSKVTASTTYTVRML